MPKKLRETQEPASSLKLNGTIPLKNMKIFWNAFMWFSMTVRIPKSGPDGGCWQLFIIEAQKI